MDLLDDAGVNADDAVKEKTSTKTTLQSAALKALQQVPELFLDMLLLE